MAIQKNVAKNSKLSKKPSSSKQKDERLSKGSKEKQEEVKPKKTLFGGKKKPEEKLWEEESYKHTYEESENEGYEDEYEEEKPKKKTRSAKTKEKAEKHKAVKPKKEPKTKKRSKEDEEEYYQQEEKESKKPFKKKKKTLFLGTKRISESEAKSLTTSDIIVHNVLAYSLDALTRRDYTSNAVSIEITDSIDDLLTENVYVLADSEQMNDLDLTEEIITKDTNLGLGADLDMQLEQLLSGKANKEKPQEVIGEMEEFSLEDLMGSEVTEVIPTVDEDTLSDLDMVFENSLSLNKEEQVEEDEFDFELDNDIKTYISSNDFDLDSLEDVPEEQSNILKVVGLQEEEDLTEQYMEEDLDFDLGNFEEVETPKGKREVISSLGNFAEEGYDSLYVEELDGFEMPKIEPMKTKVTLTKEDDFEPMKQKSKVIDREDFEEELLSFGGEVTENLDGTVSMTYQIDDIRKVHVPLNVRKSELESISKLDTSKALSGTSKRFVDTAQIDFEDEDATDILSVLGLDEGGK